jgi:rhamnosyltransferase
VRVSIVIPTLNGVETLPEVLFRIRAQRFDGEVEIVAVDSGSTDGTWELLEREADRLVRIRPHEFNHGRTRNLGIEHASGALIVLLVQDALPGDDRWLEQLTAPLRADPTVAAAYARQQPRAGASQITSAALGRYQAASRAPRRVRFASRRELEALSPLERLDACTFDNVCSCLRREVWLHHPFPEVAIAEDVLWAVEVLRTGHGIAYVPEAFVFHSHERGARYEFWRTALCHRALGTAFGLRTVPGARDLLRGIASSTVEHLAQAAREPRTRRLSELARGVGLAVAWPLGQFVGGLAAERGWDWLKARGV